MVTKNSTTVTLTGEEQTVQFDRSYPYFWVQNLGDSDVLISVDSGIVEGADGVITVPAGGSCGTMHNYTANADRLYLLGGGKVQVMGTGSAFNPFRLAKKGGGGSGGGGVAVVDAVPESPDANTLYKYTDAFLGDILMMYSGGHWRYSPLLMYPQKVFISPTEIYATGHIFDSTPSDAISVVDLAEPVQINNLIATQALKIYGQNVNNINYGWTFNFNVLSDITLGEKYLYIGVSTEKGCDYAKVIVNDGTEKSYHSESDVIGKYAIPLDTLVNGENSITVKYIKDGSSYKLDDCIYIYGVDYLYTM